MLRILFTFYGCVPIFKLVEPLRKFHMANGLLSKDRFNCSSHSVPIFISFVQNSLCIDLYSQTSQDATNITIYLNLCHNGCCEVSLIEGIQERVLTCLEKSCHSVTEGTREMPSFQIFIDQSSYI